jgi:spore germination protein YaaH
MASMGQFLANSSTGWQWDTSSHSPWFNVQDPATGAVFQFWYDDPASLAQKASLAQELGLLGVGCWQIDAVFGPGLSQDAAINALHALQAF